VSREEKKNIERIFFLEREGCYCRGLEAMNDGDGMA
jgi:hypothetical protein